MPTAPAKGTQSPYALPCARRVGSRRNEQDGPELGDVLAQASEPPIEDELVNASVVEELHKALDELSPRERMVMRLRFGFEDADPLTLQEIGDRLGLSRERVRQIEREALGRLKDDSIREVA